MDTTTVVTAARLLDGDRSWLTPLTLWDLATLADRVIMSERIFYSGSSHVPAAALNSRLGDEVFVGVPPFSDSDLGTAGTAAYNSNVAAYRNLIALGLAQHAPAGTYWADSIERVVEAWSMVTGRRVTAQEAFIPAEAQNWFTHRVELLHDPYCDDLKMTTLR